MMTREERLRRLEQRTVPASSEETVDDEPTPQAWCAVARFVDDQTDESREALAAAAEAGIDVEAALAGLAERHTDLIIAGTCCCGRGHPARRMSNVVAWLRGHARKAHCV